MAIRFSELQPVTTPTANSVFALGDANAGVSKRITFSDLTSAIITPSLFTDNSSQIITAINGSANTGNNLNAENLFYDQQYRPGSYFLDYTNFVNKPTIPTNLSQLTNSTGFVRFDSDNSKISYIPTAGGRVDISTSFVAEGTNLYYTDARVESFFDTNFGSYFTQFSTTFDEGNVTDSYFDTEGTFISIQGTGENVQSDTIRITDADRLNAYATGQTIRIYGASANLAGKLSSTDASFSITPVNFPTSGDTTAFSYRIAEFNYNTGEIAPASSAQVVNIAVPGVLPPETTIYDAFNETYFLRLNLSGVNANRGVLVYRDDNEDGTHELIAVLGPKDVESGIWIDYYDTDYNAWTLKASDNTYTSIVHFPLTPPSTSLRGWIDRNIDTVTQSGGNLDITLNETVFINGDALCEVAHNDTSKIQSAINSNVAAGLKTVTLNAKNYVASNIVLPSNFGLSGTTNITRFTRLPWALTTQTSNFFETSLTNGASEISLIGFDVDGNALNSYLFSDSVNTETNYTFNMGNAPVNMVFDRVRIIRPIGGGIYAPNHENLRITNSQITDSGLSDRLANLYSPLYVTGGTNIVTTSNRFENFTNFIDASVTNKGVITNNIIQNCGSGLLIYGSTFLSSQNNVIIGPAQEFISSPDTLNSEYDSVNISLENAYLSAGQYNSTRYVYQENGLSFDLTANNTVDPNRGGTALGGEARVYYDTFFVQRSSTGVEEVYEANTGIVLNDQGGNDKSIGEFSFTIDSGTVADISNANGQFSYSTLSALNSDHVGIVYTANFERDVLTGTISSAEPVSNGSDTIQIVMTGAANYVAVGSEVRIAAPTGSLTIPDATGIVTSYTDAAQDIIDVQFAGESFTGGDTLTAGRLNIIDRFVMAKGRIL